MADSSTLRSRRCRAHAKGDHSWCLHEALAARDPVLAVPVPAGAPVDVRGALERLAIRLEAASVAEPGNMAVAQQLRMTLVALAGEDPDGGFDVG